MRINPYQPPGAELDSQFERQSRALWIVAGTWLFCLAIPLLFTLSRLIRYLPDLQNEDAGYVILTIAITLWCCRLLLDLKKGSNIARLIITTVSSFFVIYCLIAIVILLVIAVDQTPGTFLRILPSILYAAAFVFFCVGLSHVLVVFLTLGRLKVYTNNDPVTLSLKAFITYFARMLTLRPYAYATS